jgi:hypothetical protein
MTGSVFKAATGFLRGVGSQAAVSLAASAMAAAFLALPAGLTLPFFTGGQDGGKTQEAMTERWVLPVAPDGKIRVRHQDAGSAEAPLRATHLQGLISPAAIVMPMTLDWPRPTTAIAALKPDRPVPGETAGRAMQAQASVPAPPRRPVIERAVVTVEAAPLPIAPAVQAAAVEGDARSQPPLRLLGITVPTPVARVGDAMSGAVGIVGAAGIWTLSRASSLLPRL